MFEKENNKRLNAYKRHTTKLINTHRKSFRWWCIFLHIRRIPFNSRIKKNTLLNIYWAVTKNEIYTPQSEYMKYKHMDWSNLNANDRFKWVDDLFNEKKNLKWYKNVLRYGLHVAFYRITPNTAEQIVLRTISLLEKFRNIHWKMNRWKKTTVKQ